MSIVTGVDVITNLSDECIDEDDEINSDYEEEIPLYNREEFKFVEASALTFAITKTLAADASTYMSTYREKCAISVEAGEKFLVSAGDSFESQVSTTSFYLFQMAIADDAPNSKFSIIDDMCLGTSKQVPLTAEKEKKRKRGNNFDTFSSTNLSAHVGVIFHSKAKYDAISRFAMQTLTDQMINERQLVAEDFLIGTNLSNKKCIYTKLM